MNRLFTLVLFASSAQAEIVSLYNGAEKYMNSRDRSRVITVLSTLGLDFKEDRQLQILVNLEDRGYFRDIIARSISETMSQVRPAPTAPTAVRANAIVESTEDPLDGMTFHPQFAGAKVAPLKFPP